MNAAAKMVQRSLRTDIRNPLLALPSMTEMRRLPESTRAPLRILLKEISADARKRADQCWKKHKAPMAAYWKAVAVYAGHAARALK